MVFLMYLLNSYRAVKYKEFEYIIHHFVVISDNTENLRKMKSESI